MSSNTKQRLDTRLVSLGLVSTRSQAESYIKLSKATVNGQVITKPGFLVNETADIKLTQDIQYVSRAALKLRSVADEFKLNFNDSKVLDVGSSTGGFTDFALKNGASKVIAIEVGSNQMHPSLRDNPQIELHEKTDILSLDKLSFLPDIVVIDLSFISLRQILPHLTKLIDQNTLVVAMVKPQFEAISSGLKHKGVIKNDKIRRSILQDFEAWVKGYFVITNKADSKVAGSKGNLERFYLLRLAS